MWYRTPTWVYDQFISVYITVEGSTIMAPTKFRNAAMFSYMHNNIIHDLYHSVNMVTISSYVIVCEDPRSSGLNL